MISYGTRLLGLGLGLGDWLDEGLGDGLAEAIGLADALVLGDGLCDGLGLASTALAATGKSRLIATIGVVRTTFQLAGLGLGVG